MATAEARTRHRSSVRPRHRESLSARDEAAPLAAGQIARSMHNGPACAENVRPPEATPITPPYSVRQDSAAAASKLERRRHLMPASFKGKKIPARSLPAHIAPAPRFCFHSSVCCGPILGIRSCFVTHPARRHSPILRARIAPRSKIQFLAPLSPQARPRPFLPPSFESQKVRLCEPSCNILIGRTSAIARRKLLHQSYASLQAALPLGQKIRLWPRLPL